MPSEGSFRLTARQLYQNREKMRSYFQASYLSSFERLDQLNLSLDYSHVCLKWQPGFTMPHKEGKEKASADSLIS